LWFCLVCTTSFVDFSSLCGGFDFSSQYDVYL